MACEQRRAAVLLRDRGLHRPCASRAYYAFYSQLTGELLKAGVKKFGHRGNPAHADLPGLITTRMTALPVAKRRDLAQIARRLRSRREDADYRPGVGEHEAASRESVRDLADAARLFGGEA